MFVGCFRYGYNIRAIMLLPVFASEGFVPIYVVAGLPDCLLYMVHAPEEQGGGSGGGGEGRKRVFA